MLREELGLGHGECIFCTIKPGIRRGRKVKNSIYMSLDLSRISLAPLFCKNIVMVMFRAQNYSFLSTRRQLSAHERQPGTPNPKPSRIGTNTHNRTPCNHGRASSSPRPRHFR